MSPISNLQLRVKYRTALDDYGRSWIHVDNALRDVVAGHSGTKQKDIYVNVVMIDAVYRSQLARTLRGKDPVWAASEAIRNANLMPLIQRLRTHKVLTPGSLVDVLRAHQAVLKAVNQSGRSGLVVRSFASKFLHFYSDIVPIYDSVASNELGVVHYGWRDFKKADPTLAQLDATLPVDMEYRRYVLRFLSLLERVEALLPRLQRNTKVLDHMLWRA